MMLIIAKWIIWFAGIYGLFLIVIAFVKPRLYRRIVSIAWGAPEPLIVVAGAIMVLFPLGRVIYCAGYAVTYIIPPDMGFADDTGDWTSYRFLIQFFLAVVGSFFAAAALEHITHHKR
jgi:hypothetical protein